MQTAPNAKQPFDIEKAIPLLRAAVAGFPAAAMFELAERALDEYGGELPCERDVLLSLPGVGPKCANLALGIACGQPSISVDIHVHRVANRWGYVAAPTPERTLLALENKLPPAYWIEI